MHTTPFADNVYHTVSRPAAPRPCGSRCLLRRFAALALPIALLTTAGAVANDEGEEGTRQRHLETFDVVWETISETHYDAESIRERWDEARAELRPEAAAAESTSELRAVLKDLLSRLEESHFAILPREAVEGRAVAERIDDDGGDAEDGDRAVPPGGAMQPESVDDEADVGIATRFLDGEVVVSSVRLGSAAAEADVKPGWSIAEIRTASVGDADSRDETEESRSKDDDADGDGRDCEGSSGLSSRIELLRESLPASEVDTQVTGLVQDLLAGPAGSEIEVHFQTDEGQRAVTLTRRQPDGQMARFGNLPPMTVEFDAREVEMSDGGARVGVIEFNIWLLPVVRQFDDAIDRFRQMDGIVIDLRGNPGGIGGMSMGIAGHFFDEPTSLGTFRNRAAELEFRANPRFSSRSGEPVEPFGGPVAILIDRMTGSTSEIFAGGMQATGRARVFGETSMGAALPSTTTPLPNGDVLQHAIADFISADGKRLEGRGVIPNKEVRTTRDDLLAGRDPVMEAAVSWIEAERNEPADRGERSAVPESET